MFGDYENLMAELEIESCGVFLIYPSLEPAMFHELLLQRITSRLTKQDTAMGKSLRTWTQVDCDSPVSGQPEQLP